MSEWIASTADSMSVASDRWTDLVSEMYALVREQAFLHEVTHQVRDLVSEGREVVHGPWLSSECQSVLIPWHQAGWIELVADADPPLAVPEATWRDRASREEAYLVLAVADASALLRDYSRWMRNTEDGHVMLCLSDEGSRHEFPEWVSLAERAKGAV